MLINDLLAQEKKSIEEDLSKYPTLKLSSLRRNTYASGGRPKITLLVSSWRSGSSFLGQILASHPVSFYIYEPLHQLGLVKLRDSVNEKAKRSVQLIKDLFTCNYSRKGIKLVLFDQMNYKYDDFLQMIGSVISKIKGYGVMLKTRDYGIAVGVKRRKDYNLLIWTSWYCVFLVQ